jgi:hypothetical protein
MKRRSDRRAQTVTVNARMGKTMALCGRVIAIVFLILSASAAHSLTIGPSDQDGVSLTVELGWASLERKTAIVTKIIFHQDEIIVDRYGLTPKADNEETGCGKRISRAHDPKKAISVQEMGEILDCEDKTTIINTLSVHPSVILDNNTSSHCTNTSLSNGVYQLCAEIISNSPDVIRVQYEENKKYGAKASIVKVRFDLKVLRQSENPSSPIIGCTAKIVAAFTLDPKQSNKLAPFDHIQGEQCHRGGV